MDDISDRDPQAVTGFCIYTGIPQDELCDVFVDEEGHLCTVGEGEFPEELCIFVEKGDEPTHAIQCAVRALYMEASHWAGGRLRICVDEPNPLGQWALDGMRVQGGPPVWTSTPLAPKAQKPRDPEHEETE